MGEEKKLSSDAFGWAYNEFVAGDPESEALFKEYEVKADIAQQIYDLRNQADLTQAELAKLVGISRSQSYGTWKKRTMREILWECS
jgi:DNA-binding XRE family transcriptional regulator